MPPAAVAAMNAIRSTIGSTPRRRPSPVQTPPISAPSWSRRSGGGCEASGWAALMAPCSQGRRSARAGEPGGEQDRADHGQQQRDQVAEREVDRVDLVEHEDHAERDHADPAHERGGVEVAAGHAVASQTASFWVPNGCPPASAKRLPISHGWWTTCSAPMPTWPSITSRLTPAASRGLWRQSTSKPPLSRSSTRV